MATISTQHAATFRKTIARQWIIYSFVAKETTKGIHYGNRINRKKELLRQWSQGSTASLAAWRLSANGMEKRE